MQHCIGPQNSVTSIYGRFRAEKRPYKEVTEVSCSVARILQNPVQVHAIIVQVQTLFVNFVIANSIQVTIISNNYSHLFFSCHALETGLLTRLFAVHTHKWQPPSHAVHVAAKI